MQTAVTRGCQGLKPLSARRSAARMPAFGSATSRRSSVQVFAKKGKGKTAFRQGSMPGQMEMIKREPPVPEVDPENAEIVLFVRVLKYKDPTLNMDVGPSLWMPVNLIKGNQVLNFLVEALKTDWGMRLYGRTLIWQIASGIYQDKAKVEKDLKKNVPQFANAASKDFEYAFKIRDKSVPKDWLKPENLTICPPPEDLAGTGVAQLKAFFSMDNLMSMFKAPEAPSSSAPAQQQ
ncbi:hypothetical protein VOLCADRAFT_121174 [Volvox carteri f. nagariensis]|uniref:Uncharacterized protein n=1 Tax=Volvox carteri f. nagariensis TaxID=3068 RepID=D8U418_VOLCA|nr:uncharacterized protein VOLCADRAFT_121174 [Volvox carteri f. nagariensis]EFJ45518.1 hypothetical protein VOLCADRAFT_121174 [Volvox carteri f. nagariensis]|eukprot:XP_002953545.1 hypothetical protein VOLCADRAFT_121174 [Volvox carteri f. nagariensis]